MVVHGGLTPRERGVIFWEWYRKARRCEAWDHTWRGVDKLRKEQLVQVQVCKDCRRWRIKPEGELAAVEDTGW